MLSLCRDAALHEVKERPFMTSIMQRIQEVINLM